MYQSIMVPVDMAHLPQVAKSIDTAAGLARQHGGRLVFVSVTAAIPTSIAHNPKEFAQRLEALATQESARLGVKIDTHTMTAHDPSIDTDRHLMEAITATGADLVVMATHAPGLADYFWSGHGAHVAAHAPVSVFLVR